jgi:hypothetical protein
MTTSEFSEQQLLLAGYVLGDLDVEESHALEQLLSEDPALQQELVALQMSLDAVYGQEIAPPSALKASVVAAAEQAVRSPLKSSPESPATNLATAPLPTKQPPRSKPVTSSAETLEVAGLETASPSRTAVLQRVLLIATGVLAALSFYLGWQNYSLRQALRNVELELANQPVDSAAELVTYSLDPTENATEDEQISSVELSIDRDRLEAVLTAENLPALPENQVYVLWTVIPADAPATKDAKNAILTTVFTVDAAGQQRREILLPSAFRSDIPVEAIAITVEDAEAPEAHESSPILIHRL